MEKVFRVETSASPDTLFAIVNELSTFPDWIDVVHSVESVDGSDVTKHSAQQPAQHPVEPAWWVVLRAELGPLARSKRLRMRRAVSTPPSEGINGHVRFERTETDGRDHAEWIMEVSVGALTPSSGYDQSVGSWASCRLYYGGAMWSRLLEGQLDGLADRATLRLRQLAETN